MERPKINKRKITNDWQKSCPELSKLRMLDIDNRVGPLVIGFYLQIRGDGTIYMPLYKVGNLYSHYSVLPSSLEIEGRSMDMQMHEIYSEQIAQQLIQKAYIPLQGEVTFEDVKNGYERYFKNPNKGTIVEYEDYVYISSWTRKKELFDNALHTVYNELKSWPEERYFVRDGGFKNWMLELEKKASNREVLECDISDLIEYVPNQHKITGKDLIVEEHGNRKPKKKQ